MPEKDVNKVVVGGNTVLDLTADTVTEDTLLAGSTAHDASGRRITGSVVAAPVDSTLTVPGAAADAQAVGAALAEIESKITEASEPDFYNATIGTTWQGSDPYVQVVSVPGLRATDRPDIDMIASDDFETAKAQIDAYGGMYRMVTGDDTLTIYSTGETDVAIPIQIRR